MEGYVPREDATVVTRLLDAGAHDRRQDRGARVLLRRRRADRLSRSAAREPARPGLPVPARPRTAAPSCVVTGEADLALGGDQGGSIRLPASWSGCCGHKPTFGLVPYTGIFPIELTLDHIGPMARTVRRLRADARRDRRARTGSTRARSAWSCSPTRRRSRCGADGPARRRADRGLRHPGRLGARRRRRGARRRRRARGRRRARSRRSRSRCTATGSRSGTRSPTEGATDLMVRGDALRHQPQGPLHDRPRRLLRPRAARPRRTTTRSRSS